MTGVRHSGIPYTSYYLAPFGACSCNLLSQLEVIEFTACESYIHTYIHTHTYMHAYMHTIYLCVKTHMYITMVTPSTVQHKIFEAENIDKLKILGDSPKFSCPNFLFILLIMFQ